jgi:hypothetical protein
MDHQHSHQNKIENTNVLVDLDIKLENKATEVYRSLSMVTLEPLSRSLTCKSIQISACTIYHKKPAKVHASLHVFLTKYEMHQRKKFVVRCQH